VCHLSIILCLAGMEACLPVGRDSTHVPRARNFCFENKFSSEDSPVCRQAGLRIATGQSSPRMHTQESVTHTNTKKVDQTTDFFSWLGWRDSLLSINLQKCRGMPFRAYPFESLLTETAPNDRRAYLPGLAGMEGFEPPNARTKTWCLTTWPHPITDIHCTL
jgi:hypothetical protein